MKREEILNAAKACVCGGREQDYGTPERNFHIIADLWTTYIDATFATRRGVLRIEPKDVAAMMALMKIARVASGKAKDDNWIDIAGYAACGGEIDK